MVVGSYRSAIAVFRRLLPHLFLILVYVLAITAIDYKLHLEFYNIPVAILAILGTVMGLLLAFRTNSSYARWWEARTIWGSIVNDSRSFVRQLIEFSKTSTSLPVSDPTLIQMAHRQVGWCYSLSRSLRQQDPIQDLAGILDKSEIETIAKDKNVPNRILLNQAFALRQLYESGQLELFQFVELERTVVRLTNSMGGCERIRNTPFPRSYGRLVDSLLYIFVVCLPFGLFNVPPLALILISLLFAATFLAIDRVAIMLEDPFSNGPSDTPMLALSRTIEINIRQMLGESDVPKPIDPVNGILY